jgi:hypothetical protein
MPLLVQIEREDRVWVQEASLDPQHHVNNNNNNNNRYHAAINNTTGSRSMSQM